MLRHIIVFQIVCLTAFAADRVVEMDAIHASISYIYFNIESAADPSTIADIKVTWISPGSGAEKAGLRKGDRLVAVNGGLVSGMKRNDIVNQSGGVIVRKKEVFSSGIEGFCEPSGR